MTQNQINNYKEVVEYINGWKVTNMYPIMTEEEKEKKEKELLTKLYYVFTSNNIA